MTAAFPPVADLIPQRPPMLLLDEVLAADEASITCAAVVRADNLLLQAGRLHATAVLEYMAQGIAALAGLRAREAGRPPALGVITGCRNLELGVEHLHVGDRLRVDATRLWPAAHAADELAEYRASVTCDARLVASADIHVVTVRRFP